MKDTLQTIETFIAKHHVMTLATANDDAPQCCNLFYAYHPSETLFVVASDPNTEHMKNVANNPRIAGTIVLETETVGKIEGVQFKGRMREATEDEAAAYFKRFPYAKVMAPKLWAVVPGEMKLTDNRLGFGKKLTWKRAASA